MGWELRIKNDTNFLEGGSRKNQYIGGIALKGGPG